jgi:hypothetical protein
MIIICKHGGRGLWVAVMALLLLLGTVAASPRQGYRIITTKELKTWLDSEKDLPVVINCLSPLEFANRHIPGSACIPEELIKISSRMPEDLKKPIVFYCISPG